MVWLLQQNLFIHLGYGFAAGCEARALPRRSLWFQSWAVPLVRALPFSWTRKPKAERGASPKTKK